MSNENDDGGKSQAAAQVRSLVEMVAALNLDWDRLDELRDMQSALETDADAPGMSWAEVGEFQELEEAAGDCRNYEEAVQRIQEDALSVEVRSGWHVPGEPENGEKFFRIILCTGGPHVEIEGELDEHSVPVRAWLQYQDWFTGMTRYYEVEEDTLLAYAGQFYFVQD